METMWAGRFEKPISELTNDFNASILIDGRMFEEDIRGSMAHAAMLGAQGIIAKEEADKLIGGLEGILSDMKSGALQIDESAEDIHMFVEAELTKRLGETGKRLHTARSRNDQVALDNRLYVKKEIAAVKDKLQTLLSVLKEMAKDNVETVMPGYTHLQRAQPVTFAHHLLAYAAMFMRDCDRLDDVYKRADVLPLGSCALAGTTHPIDRFAVAESLGFSEVCFNSMDGVSDRDFMLEFAAALSIAMMHLSRLSEEVVLWCSWEFKFLELDDAFATGSSIMPQKKNPDISELVRGKTGRVYGNLVALLTMMKGLPLAYNKDMQEDKENLFDSVDTVKTCLAITAEMLRTATVLKDNMLAAGKKGFINATDVADYLVKKGEAFRSAYKITGQLVAEAIAKNATLEELPLKEYQKYSPLFKEDIYGAIDLKNCVEKRTSFGGPAKDSVLAQIERVEEFLKGKK